MADEENSHFPRLYLTYPREFTSFIIIFFFFFLYYKSVHLNFCPRSSLNLLICHVPTVPSSLPYFPYIRTHTTFLHYLPVPCHYPAPLFLPPGAHCSDLATGAAQLVKFVNRSMISSTFSHNLRILGTTNFHCVFLIPLTTTPPTYTALSCL